MLKNFLVILHVVMAAGWFGMGLVIGRLARHAVGAAGSGIREVGSRMVSLMSTFIVLTFLLGLAALFAGGGFGAYGPQIHMSLTLVLILVLLQFFMIRPAFSKAAAGDAGAVKKISIATGIGHVIWLVVLILMFWNHYPLG